VAPWLAGSLAAAAAATADESEPRPQPTPDAGAAYEETIDVVAVTPLRGLGVPRDQVPVNVQTLSSTELEQTGALHLGDALAASFAGAHTNEAQANPFQPDLQLRGFTVSPLLGLPQGIAVYQDGVRVNEPFGDTLHWDLLPENAVSSIDFIPGSSPLFGLNALGGALSIQTKSGWSDAGHAGEALAGSFGRRSLELQSGGQGDRTAYFVGGRALEEDGWRDHSPSRVRQLFGSVGARTETASLGATLTSGANRLVGNGAAPIQLLAEDREAVFTHPDRTETELLMLTVRGDRALGERATLEGTAFFRPSRIDTFNGDDTPYQACEREEVAGLLCSDDGDDETPVLDGDGMPVPIGDPPLDATQNTSATDTDGWGAALQATSRAPFAERDHHWIAGASFDGARSRYSSDTELARLTADRGTMGAGIVDADAAVRLRAEVEHAGLWVADFFGVTPRLTLSGAARWSESTVRLRDQLGDDLDGDHRFSRLNPSLGLTWEARPAITAFGSFGAASRVPAPSELACADADDPCRLPNAFVADPPLDQVVAKTWEAGLRGRSGPLAWSAALFHTTNRDDILFVSSGALTNEGHFENVGSTERRGLEATASGAHAGGLRWTASYSHLRAEFRDPLLLSSPNHPEAIDGEIAVDPGDALPGVPRHQLKGQLTWTGRRAAATAAAVWSSDRVLRGDEANLLDPIDGFASVDLSATWALRPRLALAARVTNLLDAEYETFGLLGEADEVLGDEFDDPRFLTPAAPRGVWIGIELQSR
jgi:outer membrane receptor protein involved in Fe transport